MSELRGRVFAILAGGWLLATAGAAVLFGSQVLSALITGGSLLLILVIASMLALVFGFLSYRRTPKRLLSRLNAVPLSKARVPTVHASIDRLTDRMEIDRPELYIARLGQPNAFALGSSALVVDRLLVRLLTSAELEAILAHELAHLEGHDSLVQTLANSLLRTITSLTLVVLVPFAVVVSMSCWGLSLIVGRPLRGDDSVGNGLRRTMKRLVMSLIIVPTVALRAYSRRREYAADDRAVAVIDDPLALARALEKIQRATRPGLGLFSWLFSDHEVESERTPLERALASHPPTDDRIARVREAAKASGPHHGPSRWRRIEIN